MAFAAADRKLRQCRIRAAPGRAWPAAARRPRRASTKLAPYQIQGRWYYPEYDPNYDRVGVASWYGEPFHGRRTANGEVFDRDMVTAAHLPLPSLVRVVNLQNRRELVVRVNDRGPFVDDRLIDLSQEAAQLGFEGQALLRCASSSSAWPTPRACRRSRPPGRSGPRPWPSRRPSWRERGCPAAVGLHSGGRLRRDGARSPRSWRSCTPCNRCG